MRHSTRPHHITGSVYLSGLIWMKLIKPWWTHVSLQLYSSLHSLPPERLTPWPMSAQMPPREGVCIDGTPFLPCLHPWMCGVLQAWPWKWSPSGARCDCNSNTDSENSFSVSFLNEVHEKGWTEQKKIQARYLQQLILLLCDIHCAARGRAKKDKGGHMQQKMWENLPGEI